MFPCDNIEDLPSNSMRFNASQGYTDNINAISTINRGEKE
jgi:hypothetical protein